MTEQVRVGQSRWRDDSDMDVLATRVRSTSGIRFARVEGDRPEKNAARTAVLRSFAKLGDGPLTVLTLPGLRWEFEKALLHVRGGGGSSEGDAIAKLKRGAETTRLIALEREPALFAASVPYMPGRNRFTVKQDETPRWAVASVHTKLVNQYACADFVRWAEESEQSVDVAWVDLSGPLSTRDLTAMCTAWNRGMRQLVLTCMRGRHSAEMSRRLACRGGHAGLLQFTLGNSTVAEIIEYADGTPMIQVHVCRSH